MDIPIIKRTQIAFIVGYDPRSNDLVELMTLGSRPQFHCKVEIPGENGALKLTIRLHEVTTEQYHGMHIQKFYGWVGRKKVFGVIAPDHMKHSGMNQVRDYAW